MCKSHFRKMQQRRRRLAGLDVTTSVYEQIIPLSIHGGPRMPLLDHLKADKPRGWHRQAERACRGLPQVAVDTPLEDWEQDLVQVETLLLSGTEDAVFRHLAKAWGQEEGFHSQVIQSLCSAWLRPPSRSSSDSSMSEDSTDKLPHMTFAPWKTHPSSSTGSSMGTIIAPRCSPLPAPTVRSSTVSTMGTIDAPSCSPSDEPIAIGEELWNEAAYDDGPVTEALAADLIPFADRVVNHAHSSYPNVTIPIIPKPRVS